MRVCSTVMDSQNLVPLLAGIAIALLFVVGLLLGLALGRKRGRSEAEKEMPALLAGERDDAVRRSRAVIGGQVAEQLAPYLPDFPCDPQDARFIGKPVDFICFSGSSLGNTDEIVFVEVKTGGSALSSAEKTVRDAILRGDVRWVEYRIPD